LEDRVADQAQELEKVKLQLESQQDIEGPRADRYQEIIGESHAMKEVLKTLDRIIDSDVTVYIHGESGTGKELIARALHYNGPRKAKIYVSTNCASYSETLLESELFGHVRGAFTGAERDKKGMFEYADGGTVFLDEVADMSPGMQAKLLRVLQEGEIRPLGSNKTVKVNVRIISATNKDLGELVKEGKFRKDLFYRLNVVRINLPALRERKPDIPMLAQHFMKKNKMGIPENFLSIEPAAVKALMTYDWPGNIRELENEINRALVMGKGEITKELLSENVREKYEFEEEMMRDLNLDRQVSNFEKRIIDRALQESQGNKVKAAKLLGISRFTLHQKIRNLEIEHRRLEVGSLEVPELGPVHHEGLQIEVQPSHQLLDVLNGQLRVPSAVEMDRQRSQSQLVGHLGHVRAVDATAQAHDAVVLPAASGRLDALDDRLEFGLPLAAIGAVDLVPNQLVVLSAVRADAI
ncbi:MAG: sigma-54-dependent Fis family transcriptional regulator, partial [Armatimonadetes bacterium]